MKPWLITLLPLLVAAQCQTPAPKAGFHTVLSHLVVGRACRTAGDGALVQATSFARSAKGKTPSRRQRSGVIGPWFLSANDCAYYNSAFGEEEEAFGGLPGS